MKRLLAPIAAVAVVALVVTGCGSSSDGATDMTASPTKAEFLKQGNAICAAGDAEVQTGVEGFAKENNIKKGRQPTPSQLEEITETVLVPSITKQIAAINALGFPEGEEETYERFLENAKTVASEIEEDPSLLGSGKEPLTEVNEEAKEVGLAKCSE